MRVVKPTLAFLGTLVALLLLLVVTFQTLDLAPTDMQTADLKTTLLPFRVGFYLLVIAAWKPIARFLSRPRVHRDDHTLEMIAKWDELTALLVKSRWKLALFFAVFELIAIQQIGLSA